METLFPLMPPSAEATAPLAISFIAVYDDSANKQTYTFGPIGAEAYDRIIVTCLNASSASAAAITIDSASIGGSATIIDQVNSGSSGRCVSGIFARAVPAGTNPTISVTLSRTIDRAHIGVFSMTGASGVAAVDSGVDSNSQTLTTSLTVPSGGGVIATSAGIGGSPSATWSPTPPFNERWDDTTESVAVNQTGAEGLEADGTATDPQIVWSTTPTSGRSTFVAASWGPWL